MHPMQVIVAKMPLWKDRIALLHTEQSKRVLLLEDIKNTLELLKLKWNVLPYKRRPRTVLSHLPD